MRKHSPRKWLHACLDLLPVILIPVFMVFSHRHDVTHQTEVDIQYKYQSNEVNSIDDIVYGNVYHVEHFEFYAADIDDYFVGEFGNFDAHYKVLSVGDFSFDGDFEIDELELTNGDFSNSSIDIYINQGSLSVVFPLNDFYSWYFAYGGIYFDDADIIFFDDDGASLFYYNQTINDGTLPILSSYNSIVSVSVDNTQSTVTDAFVKQFCGTVNTYFNFDNALPFTNGIYEWLNTNLFNGNIPVLASAIWHIIVYEFIMDLMFILYAFFMFLIDFTEYVLEKPFDKVTRC